MELASSITFRLSDDLYNEVLFYASFYGLSVSEVIRIALNRLLDYYD